MVVQAIEEEIFETKTATGAALPKFVAGDLGNDNGSK